MPPSVITITHSLSFDKHTLNCFPKCCPIQRLSYPNLSTRFKAGLLKSVHPQITSDCYISQKLHQKQQLLRLYYPSMQKKLLINQYGHITGLSLKTWELTLKSTDHFISLYIDNILLYPDNVSQLLPKTLKIVDIFQLHLKL